MNFEFSKWQPCPFFLFHVKVPKALDLNKTRETFANPRLAMPSEEWVVLQERD